MKTHPYCHVLPTLTSHSFERLEASSTLAPGLTLDKTGMIILHVNPIHNNTKKMVARGVKQSQGKMDVTKVLREKLKKCTNGKKEFFLILFF